MEADLRTIITADPKNVVALNALGYTLADRNERLGEALILIGAALQLDKDNPAILDSMGWVLYRLDKPQEALIFLAQAYSKNQDSEIAAHLAEVLWHTDQQEQAKVILKRAWLATPDHKVLNATIQRIIPDFEQQLDSIQINSEPEPPSAPTPADAESVPAEPTPEANGD
jgi:Flp pilus assembly protein TadD